ncbi:Heterokaryon incompatibility [Purpureocillium lavendulum]|uniref:Heterokaryon incompatibility n=1 Tax=Purpureocillium lavendulum TaxID=1247861 RepID=A0AB34G5E0_9HYPO|nr:Heterokaryon incompatibility [Purpureocillium lavendulum]
MGGAPSATMPTRISEIFQFPDELRPDRYWEEAAAAWAKSSKEATITGRCIPFNNYCVIDFEKFSGWGSHGVNSLLRELDLPKSFWVACHEESPCRVYNDTCLWHTHPPQAASCQTTMTGNHLIIRKNGEINPDNGLPYGRITHTKITSAAKYVDYAYNGKNFHGNFQCIFQGKNN